MRVGVVGINHKIADLKLREELAKACQKWFGLLRAIHGHHFFILLSTCNRTEVYFCSQDLAFTHTYLLSILRQEVTEEFDHKLYSYFGIDCFHHLIRVTSGLDSAILGETEIQGQVKLAYEKTAEYHALPSDLHFLFQKALGISKKLRLELQLNRGIPNFELLILQKGKEQFSEIENTNILFVGASEINRKILNFFKGKNFKHLTLCNRSDAFAQKWVEHYHLQFLAWENLKDWIEYDWILFGTRSPDYLVTSKDVGTSALNKKLVMDLSVPRNVEPELEHIPNLTLLNIDQINQHLKLRSHSIDHTVAIAEQKTLHAARSHFLRFDEKEKNKNAFLAVNA